MQFVNQSFCDLFDLDEPPADLRGLSSQEMIKKIINVYADPADVLTRIREAIAKGQPLKSVEIAIRGGRTYMTDFIPIWIDGKQHGRVWHHMDITARKQAEEVSEIILKRFFAVLSSMHNAILLVGNDERVEFANQAFCDYFALREPPADLTGLASQEMMEKIRDGYLEPDGAIARIREIVDLGQPVLGEEIAMQGGRTCLRDFIPVAIDGISYGRVWHHSISPSASRQKER